MAAETSVSLASSGYLALLKGNPNFRWLWAGEVISLFGDWFNLIASAALIANLTASGLAIGSLFVVRMLAPLLVSPLAGVVADRYNRKYLLIASDLLRAGIVLCFLLVREARFAWLLYLLTFLHLGVSGFSSLPDPPSCRTSSLKVRSAQRMPSVPPPGRLCWRLAPPSVAR